MSQRTDSPPAAEDPNRWFVHHLRNVTSQAGEDGVLERVFQTLGIRDGWCVEFGAWDGRKFSNTYDLITRLGWRGVLIEASARKYQDLLATYARNERVTSLNRFVHYSGPDTLDRILAETAIPRDFDLLSIDIDGNDYRQAGIDIIDNTPEEILGLALEQLERTEGRAHYTPADEDLQAHFKSLMKPGHYTYGSESRIGRDFLRVHAALL